MMKQMQKTLCAMAALAMTAGAVQAQSVNLNLTGKIVPAACVPVLAGGGTMDYGSMDAGSLNFSSNTRLTDKSVNFTITCGAPTSIALQANSMRKGSLPVAEGSMGDGYYAGYPMIGLGRADNDAKIGGFSPYIKTLSMDGNDADFIIKKIGGDLWGKTGGNYFFPYGNGIYQTSFAEKGQLLPATFTTVAGTIGIRTSIAPASTLDLSKPIHLDGMMNVEMIYL